MSRRPSISNEPTPAPLKGDQASSYLATLVASSDDALIGQSPDGTILSWNAAAERLYGYSADEAVGRNVSLIVPPEGRDELSDLLERIRRGEHIRHQPVQRRRRNGAMILVSLSVSPVHDVDGSIIGAAAVARGIVEDGGDSAVEAARYARSLIEMSINPLVTINPQGKITDVNMATEEATGIAREKLIGTDFADCFSEPEKAQAGYQRVLEEGLLSDYPLVLRHVSGALTNVEYNATVYRDGAGELQAVFVAARDAAEAQKARLQVARLAAIVTASQNAMFSEDLEGTITSWNAAAERLYGYSADEAVGRNVSILLPPGHEVETQDLIKRMLRGDRGFGFETQRLHKDGSLLDVALALSPIRDATGDIVGLSVIGHDISGRVRTERKLRESEEKFAAAFHASPDLMAITRLSDGKLLEVNEGFMQLLGYTRDEAIGTSIAELSIWADPEDRASFIASLEPTGQTSVFDITLRRKDGGLIACITSARTIELRGETCILSVFHDITERKRAEKALRRSEEALRESEARLSDIIFSMGDWVWEVDANGVYTFSSQKSFDFFGPSRGDVIGKTPFDFMPADEAERVGAVFAEIAANRAPIVDLENWNVGADGERFCLLTNGVPVLDDAGNLTGYRGVDKDITERKQAEQAASEHAHFLEELLEAVPVPVFYKNTALRYVGCNEAFPQLLGLARGDVIGKTVFEVYPAAQAKHYDETDRLQLAHPDTPLESEIELPDPNRGARFIVTHKAVFSDVGGKPAGIVGVDLDVTEIRQAEQELVASAVQLKLTLKAAVAALGSTTEMRDPYTAGHQRRVAELAGAIAAELGWDEGRIGTLRTAALLHDIGKIVVPAEILSKPGRLTETEMMLIRQHAAAGADTVADIDFDGAVAEMIRQHHERLDGSGYPAGLSGSEILPEARVLAVADVVEAMISHRPYRAALGMETALAEIREHAGVMYDDTVVAVCVRLVEEQGFQFTP